MKKILFMVSSMNIGGVEKSLLSLLSVIPRDKYKITVLVLEKKGGFLDYIPDWVKVEEAEWFKEFQPIIMQPPHQTIKDYFYNRQFLRILSFTLVYYISKLLDNRYLYYKQVFASIPHNGNTYDLAITYQGPTDIIDYYIAHKVKAAKKISWVHFDVSKHLINTKLYKKLFNKFDKIFVVSQEAKKHLIEKIPTAKNKADVFTNIVPVELINQLSKEKVNFDNRYKGIKLVTVGRLSHEKGQDMAIKVLFRLRQAGYDVRWYCVGDGRQKKEYEFLIDKFGLKNDFILLGSKINPYPYIAKADIYVQTSRHEGYCLTLAEAKCLFKPIITTNFTGAHEQINNGYNGLIVSCCEEELYNKIKYLIDNKVVRERFRINLSNNKICNQSQSQKLFD